MEPSHTWVLWIKPLEIYLNLSALSSCLVGLWALPVVHQKETKIQALLTTFLASSLFQVANTSCLDYHHKPL